MKTAFHKSKVTLFLVGLFFVFQSQNHILAQFYDSIIEQEEVPVIYFGVGLGVNDYGFGINAEFPLSDKVSVNGNLGLGGWGYKIGGSLNMYPSNVMQGSEFSIGYTRASGLKNFEAGLRVEPSGTEQTVNIDLEMVWTINLSYTYNVKVGRNCKLGISTGYAVSLTKKAYHVNSPVTLTEESRMLLKIMQPGGLIFGAKFMFGAV